MAFKQVIWSKIKGKDEHLNYQILTFKQQETDELAKAEIGHIYQRFSLLSYLLDHKKDLREKLKRNRTNGIMLKLLWPVEQYTLKLHHRGSEQPVVLKYRQYWLLFKLVVCHLDALLNFITHQINVQPR